MSSSQEQKEAASWGIRFLFPKAISYPLIFCFKMPRRMNFKNEIQSNDSRLFNQTNIHVSRSKRKYGKGRGSTDSTEQGEKRKQRAYTDAFYILVKSITINLFRRNRWILDEYININDTISFNNNKYTKDKFKKERKKLWKSIQLTYSHERTNKPRRKGEAKQIYVGRQKKRVRERYRLQWGGSKFGTNNLITRKHSTKKMTIMAVSRICNCASTLTNIMNHNYY